MHFLWIYYEKAMSEKWRPVTWKAERMISNVEPAWWVSVGWEGSICQIQHRRLAPWARRGLDGGPLNTPLQFYISVQRAVAPRAVWYVRWCCPAMKMKTLNLNQFESAPTHTRAPSGPWCAALASWTTSLHWPVKWCPTAVRPIHWTEVSQSAHTETCIIWECGSSHYCGERGARAG